MVLRPSPKQWGAKAKQWKETPMSEEEKNRILELSRRGLLGGSAKAALFAGLTGAVGGGTAALAGRSLLTAHPAQAASPSLSKTEVKPGDLDEYYVFSSGGQSGEVRILGLPSMRELMRIPVFN